MSGGPAASRTSSSAPARRPRLKRARSWSTSSRRLSQQARAALADTLPSARSKPCASRVNGELDVLKSGLEAAIRWANPGGRICVISYHSLEDRIVKDMFQSFANRCTCPPDLPVCMCGKEPILKVLTRKPIVPTARIARNPRARSAKLRVAQKL